MSFRAGTSEAVQTHRLVWEPARLTYATYAGEGFGGTLLKQTRLTGPTIPVPARERLHVNFGVFGGRGGDPGRVCTDPADQTAHQDRRWEPKRHRLRLLASAGRLAVSARCPVLHLAAGGRWTGVVLAILTRFRALPAPSG